MARTRELITPWNSLNIQNGRRHAYSGDVYAQHAGTGRWKGNRHNHWAMANGGTIDEPIFGVGTSGRTYSFGENYMPERVIPNWQGASSGSGGGGPTTVINLTIPVAIGVHPREVGRQVVEAIGAHLSGGGSGPIVHGKRAF
jgi:hypothetical protein